MIHGVQLKVCGLTRVEDAVAAAGIGADFLGFIFYPRSPRHVGEEMFSALRARLPEGPRRVAVCVAPTPAELARLGALGFDAFQIHFDLAVSATTIAAWGEIVGVSRLWLAPKLPPTEDVRAEWLRGASSVLLDTFHVEKYGGTGETGDWAKFQRHQAMHPETTWILSGGLKPENIGAARAATGARFFDVNSGVESAPGVKDAAKLAALAAALHAGK